MGVGGSELSQPPWPEIQSLGRTTGDGAGATNTLNTRPRVRLVLKKKTPCGLQRQVESKRTGCGVIHPGVCRGSGGPIPAVAQRGAGLLQSCDVGTHTRMHIKIICTCVRPSVHTHDARPQCDKTVAADLCAWILAIYTHTNRLHIHGQRASCLRLAVLKHRLQPHLGSDSALYVHTRQETVPPAKDLRS